MRMITTPCRKVALTVLKRLFGGTGRPRGWGMGWARFGCGSPWFDGLLKGISARLVKSREQRLNDLPPNLSVLEGPVPAGLEGAGRAAQLLDQLAVHDKLGALGQRAVKRASWRAPRS